MWVVIRPVQGVTEDIFIRTLSEATAQCELFLTAPNRNILTYLLRSAGVEGHGLVTPLVMYWAMIKVSEGNELRCSTERKIYWTEHQTKPILTAAEVVWSRKRARERWSDVRATH